MTVETKFEPDSNAFKLQELDPAPEIFVDGYQGAVVAQGVAKFNFFSIINDPLDGENKRRVVLRLTCTVGTVDALRKAFDQLIEELKTAGAIVEVKPNGTP